MTSTTELMNWLDVADYFRIPEKLTDEQRARKIKNWLKNKVLPRWTTTKVGNEILFIRSELDKFIEKSRKAQKQQNL